MSVLIKRVFDCGGLPCFLARSFRSSAVKLSKRKRGKKRENVYGQVILPYTLNYSGTVAPWARGKTPNRKKQYQAQEEKNNMFTRTLDVFLAFQNFTDVIRKGGKKNWSVYHVLREWVGRIRAHPYRDGLCLIQGERQQEKTKVALFEVYILPLQEKKHIVL